MTYMQPDRSTARRWDYLPEFAAEQLPRYTSYPPANRFHEGVGASEARAALGRLPDRSELSLYIHIPYCRKLCWYCGCNTSVPTPADPVERYVQALLSEIRCSGELCSPHATVARLHFGGGSPDILSPDQTERTMAALRAAFRFQRFAEIAAEFDPRGLTPACIDAFARNGLTRASLGVQVLDDAVQARINRVQPASAVEMAIRRLRAAGVEAINVDMMYGLPGQTADHVIETASFAGAQDADRIAVFGYAHIPWMKKHQKGISPDDLPSGEPRFRQAEAAALTLEHAGYLPVGFDHFAAPGDSLAAAAGRGQLHRNFQGYTDDTSTALIGMGASSISSLPGLIYQNRASSTAYCDALSAGRLPVARGVVVDETDTRIAHIIERLLCDFEADVCDEQLIASPQRLERALSAGLAERCGRRIAITTRGRPYARTIAACFDPGLAPSAARHSLAV